MCCNCTTHKNNQRTVQEMVRKFKNLKPYDSCSCNEQEPQQQEHCQDSCEDSCTTDENSQMLKALINNAQTALSQIQDMVEEIEETLDDVKEAIGQTEEDLEQAHELIEDLA